MAAAVFAATASAWACVPIPIVTLQPSSSGPPGTLVTVRGTYFLERGTIDIRWNEVDGPVLATTEGMEFSTEVRIPDAPAGLYTIVVLSRRADGSLNDTKAAVVFQVTGTDQPSPTAPREQRSRPAPPAPPGDSSPDGVNPAAAAGGGAVLVLLGGAGGFALSRRRPRPGPTPAM